jgi:hypothetical protein
MSKPATRTQPDPGNPPRRTPRTVGDGNHGGPGGTHKYCEQENREKFRNPGILKPPSSDGRSAGMDGTIEGSVNVPRTRISGSQDPVDGKR